LADAECIDSVYVVYNAMIAQLILVYCFESYVQLALLVHGSGVLPTRQKCGAIGCLDTLVFLFAMQSDSVPCELKVRHSVVRSLQMMVERLAKQHIICGS
jgi:hypothetical protein